MWAGWYTAIADGLPATPVLEPAVNSHALNKSRRLLAPMRALPAPAPAIATTTADAFAGLIRAFAEWSTICTTRAHQVATANGRDSTEIQDVG
jgi:hypothetical protein